MELQDLFKNLGDYIATAVALGAAAYALVDGSKAIMGGVSNCGFGYIKKVVKRFFPKDAEKIGYIKNVVKRFFLKDAEKKDSDDPLQLSEVLDTLRANWLNGTALADQKAIAKSLIKLRLNIDNAPELAKATGVNKEKLAVIAAKIASGETLTQDENDLFGRFDLMLTAILDQGYQRADQSYRNSAKAWSIIVSVVLALVGAMVVYKESLSLDKEIDFNIIGGAILLGLAATPIAPIAKDLTSALAAGVKAAQMLRK